ncbi:glutaminyl-peptide cyclotransferase [Aggregatilineales bacterium SYSU G02658]
MRRLIAIWAVIGVVGAVSAQNRPSPLTPPPILVPEVINVFPHDGQAFTQGLLWHDGKLYESTGKRGFSSLREVDLTTGEVLRLVNVNRPEEELSGDNPLPDYFAEGLVLLNDRLIQLTWTEGEAFVYDLATFERIDTLTYEGEGWGICYDGRYLFMSDSTSYLQVRNPETFELIVSFGVLFVSRNNQTGETRVDLIPAQLLNELECVGDYIYANLWQTDLIAQIDKRNGNVVAFIDASGLLTDAEIIAARQRDPGATLNGIAYNPETETFFLTGKMWDKLFEVRFVPARR